MAKSIWDTLNQEITMQDLKTFFGRGGKGGAREEATTDEVEALLRQAEGEAEQRGITVEQVLVERGFVLPQQSPRPAAEPEEKAALLRSLAWEPVSGPDGPSPTAELRAVQRQTQLDVPSGMFAEEERRRITDSLQHRQSLPRLRLLTSLDSSDDQRLRSAAEAGELLPALLSLNLPQELLLDVADCVPWAIPHGQASAWIDDLLMADVVPYRALRESQQAQREHGGPLLAQLAGRDDVEAAAVLAFLAKKGSVQTASEPPDHPCALREALLPFVHAFDLVPVRDESAQLSVAAGFLIPQRVLNALEVAEGKPVLGLLALPEDVAGWRDAWLEGAEEVLTSVAEPDARGGTLRNASTLPTKEREAIERAAAHGSAVDLVRQIFESALGSRATDIHLEPFDRVGRIRFRVDGVCVEAIHLNRTLFQETLARIKVLADLDVTERRRPQDGHVRFVIDHRPLDMRIATMPTRRGEKMAIRLADATHARLTLSDLGMNDAELQLVRGIASRPYGLMLATGPVGSGKTTTLYACLEEVDRTLKHVASIEDPVEIELEGVNQIEVNRSIGVDFVSGLRALLRQDPDVLLIGEIRDEETAKIAVRAAMTGRLVYSTLHANTAAAAVTTLRNLGIADFMIAASLQGIIAQRLLRKVCVHCAEPVTLDAGTRKALGINAPAKSVHAKRGRGCAQCGFTGYHGRTGIFEVLPIDETLRDMVLACATHHDLETYAHSIGCNTLADAAARKVAEGATTVEERFRILGR